jgi:predicted phage terminase large subunit-like protein
MPGATIPRTTGRWRIASTSFKRRVTLRVQPFAFARQASKTKRGNTLPDFHYSNGNPVPDETTAIELTSRYPLKFWWFLEHGYQPHPFQMVFHANTSDEKLCRNRHLVAGRRGGKTLSAAWEVLFYVLHPQSFHKDAHGTDDDRPLHVWVLTKDYPLGMAALLAFRDVLKTVGLTQGVEYKENRGNRWFEFDNGSFVQFKTADNPETLRGAGLDILWMDEAAIIPDAHAWDVVRPALSDKLGLVVSTTTPSGKNWFYHEFWGDKAKTSSNHGRVEYRSIDNPFFPYEEWVAERQRMHPMLFAQEYMASFDSFAGKELHGDWLHYYEKEELNGLELRKVIGVDPAISLADTADRFAIALVGITKNNEQAYLLELWAGRIPFPEQVEKIKAWWLQYRPQTINVERTAYQAALVQQVMRLPGLPPVVGVWARGKKFERILGMAPLFQHGRIKVRKDHVDFINEWIDYDSTRPNPDDDTLDAVEIALRGAGVVLPRVAEHKPKFDDYGPATDIEELARRDRPKSAENTLGVDEHLGADW